MSTIVERLSAALARSYRIERELGAGGMATVYLAHDIKHERDVAIKVLHPDLGAALGGERFLTEIRTTARLQHPHILPLLDSGEADGLLFYVMPLVTGETLRARLQREKQLPIDDALRIASETADALSYAHGLGIIHRDIKPENILLQNNHAIVADFGIALAVSNAGDERMTQTGLSLGTPHYMSPEQAMGERNIDARADVYALGCVTFEMLAGEPPFTGPNSQAIVAKVLTDVPRPLGELRRTVPTHVAAVVARALQKLPADRFGTAAEFANALSNPAFATTVAGAATRNKESVRAWKLATAALTVAAIATATFAVRASSKQPAAPVTRFRLGFAPDEQPTSSDVLRFALSPDGRRIAYVSGDSSTRRLWVRDLDQLNARVLPGTEGAQAPFFSPNGERVAFFTTKPAALKIIAVNGENPVVVVRDSVLQWGGDWTDNGRLYFSSSAGVVMRVSENGGAPTTVSVLDATDGQLEHDWVQALPGGNALLVTAWRGDFGNTGIAVVDVKTGRTRPLVAGLYARYVAPGTLLYVTAEGVLFGVPFDADKLEMTGSAVPLIDGMHVGYLTATPDLALSRSGTLLYQSGHGVSGEYAWVPTRQSGVVAPLGLSTTAVSYALSPDLRKLALSVSSKGGSDIWVRDMAQGTLTRLTLDAKLNRNPEWTADGKGLMYISSRSGKGQVYFRSPNGTGQDSVLFVTPERVVEFASSPDGKVIAYSSGASAKQVKLYAKGFGTDTNTSVVSGENATQVNPTFSRDGRWIAYASNESGVPQVYVRPFPNINNGKYQISTLRGVAPRFTHDGKHLVYHDGDGNFWRITFSGTESFQHTTPVRILASGEYKESVLGGYDVDSTGDRLLLARQASARSGDFVIVLNFSQEIERRIKARR